MHGTARFGRTGLPPKPEELSRVAQRLEGATAQDILCWALRTYGDELALSLSFGGAGGMVLLDMLRQLGAEIYVFTLDTGFLFKEVVKFREEVAKRYRMRIEVVRPMLTATEQAQQFGGRLYEKNPDLCCYLRKVEPQAQALAQYDAWVTAVRRPQTRQRIDTPVIEWEDRFGVAKIAPLASWSTKQIMDYVEKHDVPLVPLLRQGYKSIGCEPCTQKVRDGEQERAGRWVGSEKVECGLHWSNNPSVVVTGKAAVRPRL